MLSPTFRLPVCSPVGSSPLCELKAGVDSHSHRPAVGVSEQMAKDLAAHTHRESAKGWETTKRPFPSAWFLWSPSSGFTSRDPPPRTQLGPRVVLPFTHLHALGGVRFLSGRRTGERSGGLGAGLIFGSLRSPPPRQQAQVLCFSLLVLQ